MSRQEVKNTLPTLNIRPDKSAIAKHCLGKKHSFEVDNSVLLKNVNNLNIMLGKLIILTSTVT